MYSSPACQDVQTSSNREVKFYRALQHQNKCLCQQYPALVEFLTKHWQAMMHRTHMMHLIHLCQSSSILLPEIKSSTGPTFACSARRAQVCAWCALEQKQLHTPPNTLR